MVAKISFAPSRGAAVTAGRAHPPGMRDECAYCGRRLLAGAARRYCSHACRQAAHRARGRFRASLRAMAALTEIAAELGVRCEAIDRMSGDIAEAQAPTAGAWTAAAGEIETLAREFVRVAVVAERNAGTSWSTIGTGLGLTGEAARARYDRVRLHPQVFPHLARWERWPRQRP